jgi:hypothetical protein
MRFKTKYISKYRFILNSYQNTDLDIENKKHIKPLFI